MSNIKCVKEFRALLQRLKINNRTEISLLTEKARNTNAKIHAEEIVSALVDANDVSGLLVLYVVDSIIKGIGQPYTKLIKSEIVSLFIRKFIVLLEPEDRKKMFHLRRTWEGVFPSSTLHSLDIAINNIDSAWPKKVVSERITSPLKSESEENVATKNTEDNLIVIDDDVIVIDDSESSSDSSSDPFDGLRDRFANSSSDDSSDYSEEDCSDDPADGSQTDSSDDSSRLDELNELNVLSTERSSEKCNGRPIYKDLATGIVQVKRNFVTKNEIILVSQEEMDFIFDSKYQKFKTDTYVSYFVKQMEKYVSCTLRSNGARVCKSTFTIKFKCMHYKDCKRKYQLVCQRRVKIQGCYAFRILFNNTKINHKNKIARQCRGIDRKEMLRRLRKKTVDECRESLISRSNKNLLKKGNLQNVYSVEVLRKIRSEALRKDDLHVEAIAELGRLKTLQENDDIKDGTRNQFIRGVGNNPFFVHAFSHEQLSFVRDMYEKNELSGLHFDATGRMAQQPKDVDKRTLYYAGVVSFKVQSCDKATLVPAFHSLMSSHDIPAMKNLLMSYKDKLVEVTNVWPVFKFVVSDGNFAALHSLSEVFNGMDLISYINAIYDKIHSDDPCFDELTQIKLCCAHLMKNQANLVSTSYRTSDVAVIYNVKCMVAAMYDKDWIEIQEYWKRLHVLFNSEFETEHTRKAFSEIQKEIGKGSDLKVDSQEEVENIIENQAGKKKMALYARSKFYIALRRIQTKFDYGKEKRKTKNPYYNPEFEATFLKRYATLLPLWVNCTNLKRQSNCFVEGYFKIIKGRLDLKHTKLGRMPIKARRLLVEVQSYVKNKLSEYWLSIPKCRATGRKVVSKKRKLPTRKVLNATTSNRIRDNKSPELDDRTVEESWNGKPRKNMRSYFNSLSKMAVATTAEKTKRKVKSNRLPRLSLVKQKKGIVKSNRLPRSSQPVVTKRRTQSKGSSDKSSPSTVITKRKTQSKGSLDKSSPSSVTTKRKTQSKGSLDKSSPSTVITKRKTQSKGSLDKSSPSSVTTKRKTQSKGSLDKSSSLSVITKRKTQSKGSLDKSSSSSVITKRKTQSKGSLDKSSSSSSSVITKRRTQSKGSSDKPSSSSIVTLRKRKAQSVDLELSIPTQAKRKVKKVSVASRNI